MNTALKMDDSAGKGEKCTVDIRSEPGMLYQSGCRN